MAETHIIRVEQGNVSQPAQVNQNPSIAESPTFSRGQSAIGTTIDTAIFYESAKQIGNGVVSRIGNVTGNYELQNKVEANLKIGGTVLAIAKAPQIAIPASIITISYAVYDTNLTQQRNQFKQQQQQILTGKISTNGGKWV